MQALFQDLQYGLRMLAKTPGVSAVLVFTLAHSIGANSTPFSFHRWIVNCGMISRVYVTSKE